MVKGAYRILVEKPEGYHVEGLSVCGEIILKLIFRMWNSSHGMD